MTDEELIAWVRNGFGNAAADRIGALKGERDKYRDAFNTNCLVLRGTEERAERLEAALRELACKCPSNCDWEHDDICPSWTARVALKGEDHD